MDEPRRSNFDEALTADTSVRWRIGRAYCNACHQVKAFVARYDVEDLRCDCGELCTPAHAEDQDEHERR